MRCVLRLRHVTLISEGVGNIRGSCCDDGRYLFKECGNWWYNCQTYGLRNLTNFLRFGANGFTMSLTEHMGRCVYSPTRRTCERPIECSQQMSARPQSVKELCREVPSVESTRDGVPSVFFDRQKVAAQIGISTP
jgi:hypothetical protein